jgi:hypothetical protein
MQGDNAYGGCNSSCKGNENGAINVTEHHRSKVVRKITDRLTRPHKPNIKAIGDKLRKEQIYPLVDEIQRVNPTISLESLTVEVRNIRGEGCMQTLSSRYNHNRRYGIPVAKPADDIKNEEKREIHKPTMQ